jgi:hypothetical protein
MLFFFISIPLSFISIYMFFKFIVEFLWVNLKKKKKNMLRLQEKIKVENEKVVSFGKTSQKSVVDFSFGFLP